jgi:hypothetical protein
MSNTRTPAKGPVVPVGESVGHCACAGGFESGGVVVRWGFVSDMVFRWVLSDFHF